MNADASNPIPTIIFFIYLSFFPLIIASRNLKHSSDSQLYDDDSITYIWPLPSEFSFGNQTLAVDPNLSLAVSGNGGGSAIVKEAFERYKLIIFKHHSKLSKFGVSYDIEKLNVIVHSANEELQLGVDESYSLLVDKRDEHSIIGEITIEANSVYGALRGLETLSQLCAFDYGTKTVQVYKAPWYIQDKPRFEYRGLLLDTSRHYLPIDIIKQVIDSMSYAKLNVLHWHIIDEESFPLEVPTYPNLWKGAYTKWERYTMEDASEVVNFAKMRGINVMAEVDVPGHAESWGVGYPDLWPSPSCKEPLDVSKNFTFDVVSGILAGHGQIVKVNAYPIGVYTQSAIIEQNVKLAMMKEIRSTDPYAPHNKDLLQTGGTFFCTWIKDMRKVFPFKLFHLGGDEVHTDCWTSTPSVKQWLQDHNMTGNDAYQYFVLRAQKIAASLNWTPVNWEETFNTFPTKLNPQTIVHNWLGSGVCPKAVAKGFRCIFSNQGVWYLDHLDVPWSTVYYADPLEGITDASEQKLVLGGEACMWGEKADASNVQQTTWPRAAAVAERLWSNKESASSGNTTLTALHRLEYFRCLLTRRGVQAAPVTNFYARRPPTGPGSCYEQ